MVGYYKLCQAYVPVTNYNVSSTNNVIPFYENLTVKTATLTPGYYDTSSLLEEVAVQKTVASLGFATYSVTQSALPLRITITSTQNFQLQFGSNTVNSAAAVLGYTPVDTGMATSHLASNIANLAAVRSFNISINNESSFIDSQGRSCSFVIPILGNTGSVSVYEPTAVFPQTTYFTSHVSTLNIKVTDDNGVILNLSSDFYFMHKC